MHYYQFNIGDYAAHTTYLNPMEDLGYRRLLDQYYLHEKPLTNDIKNLCRTIGMRDYEEEIKQVLDDFFVLDGDSWTNARADKEIASYRSKADTARLNGTKGGRPRGSKKPRKTQPVKSANPEVTQQKPDSNPEITGSKAKHKPLNKKQETVTKSSTRAKALDFSSWPQTPSEQILSDYKKLRATKRASFTQTVVNSMGKQFVELAIHGISVDQTLSICCERGWTGLKGEWVLNHLGGDNGSHQQRNGQSSAAIDDTDTSWIREFNGGTGGGCSGDSQPPLQEPESNPPSMASSPVIEGNSRRVQNPMDNCIPGEWDNRSVNHR